MYINKQISYLARNNDNLPNRATKLICILHS